MTKTARSGVLGIAALGLALSGCTSAESAGSAQSQATASPSSSQSGPTTLHMAFVNRLADEQIAHLQSEVSDRSGGALTIGIHPGFPGDSLSIEQDVVNAVIAGDLDLGLVGARAFRELGIHDFDALIAPMAIDSMTAQEAVLSSDLPTRMMAGLQPHGATGLAIIAGPMRRPTAADSPLTTLEDFAGIPFYTFHGEVNRMAVEALGATHIDKPAPERNADIEAGVIRAYENTLAFLAHTVDWPTKYHTTNINLWPAVSVLIANPNMLAALSDAERAALVAAAADTADRATELLVDEAALADEVCAAGARLAAADPRDLAEIEQALAPVHAELRTDPLVAGYLDEIEALTRGIPADSLPIPDGCAAA